MDMEYAVKKLVTQKNKKICNSQVLYSMALIVMPLPIPPGLYIGHDDRSSAQL